MPEPTEPLDLIAARYRLGMEDGHSLVKFAESYLAGGHDDESVVRLAIVEPDEMSEVGPAFESVCRQLDHEIPSLGDAVRIAAAGALSEIVSGQKEPYDGLRELEAIYDRVWLLKRPDLSVPQESNMVGGEFGFERLIGAYYGYDDLRERPAEVSFEGKFGAEAVEALNQYVVTSAAEWLDSDENLRRV